MRAQRIKTGFNHSAGMLLRLSQIVMLLGLTIWVLADSPLGAVLFFMVGPIIASLAGLTWFVGWAIGRFRKRTGQISN